MPIRTLFSCIVCCSLLIACGGSGGGQSSAVPPASGAPGLPTRVRTDVGSGRIEVTWKGVANVSHYNVYYRDTPGVTKTNGIKVANVRSPAILTGLLNGTTYYIVVSAENASGEGQTSPEVNATPELKLPVLVTDFRVTPGDSSVTLEWGSQVDTDSHNIYWWTDSEANADLIANVTSPLRLPGLANGVLHQFDIVGINALGEGRRTGPIHATPIDPATGWSTQYRISELYFDAAGGTPSSGTSVSLSDVAINDNGIAAATWIIGPGVNASSVMANHNVAGQWSTDLVMQENADLARPAISVTPSAAVVVAYEKDRATIWSRIYENGAWQDPARIDSMGQHINRYAVDLASDAGGNVFAAWQEARIPPGNSIQSQVHQVWTRRYDATTGSWGGATMLVESVRQVRKVTIAAAGDDRAIAAWLQDTQAYDQSTNDGGPSLPVVHASHFDGNSWAPATAVGRTNITGDEEGMEFAVDINEAGTALVASTLRLYPTGNQNHYELEVTRLNANTGNWTTPILLRDSPGYIGPPAAAIDASGRSLVAWFALESSPPWRPIQGSIFDPGTMLWSPHEAFTQSEGGHVAVDKQPGGATIAAWDNNNGVQGVFTRRSADGSSNWGQIDLLGGHTSGLKLALSPNGHIIVGATYLGAIVRDDGQSGGETAIVVSTYTP